jgi:hypothetical protein
MLLKPLSFPRGCSLRPVLAALLLPFLAVGCSGGSAKIGVVNGKVSIDGKPPAAGTTVVFYGPENKQAAAPVDPDGSYHAVDVPVGMDKIAVKGVSQMSGAAAGKMKPIEGMGGTAQGVPVPKKYESPDNGLTLDVKSGTQEFNIELKK